MLFKILFVLAVLSEAAFLPCYLFAGFCKGGRRSLIAKCVCSVLFILIGVFAMLSATNYSLYAVLMLIGLVFSFGGDYFLSVTDTTKDFVTGVACFLSAHLFYIYAYSKAIHAKIPGSSFFNPYELFAVVMLLVILFLSQKKLGLEFGEVKIPIFVYTAVIIIMLVKAVSLSIQVYTAGVKDATAIAVLVGGGAFLFVVSDAILSLIKFGDKKSSLMRNLNLSTYYCGQVLLACSIFFVKL